MWLPSTTGTWPMRTGKGTAMLVLLLMTSRGLGPSTVPAATDTPARYCTRRDKEAKGEGGGVKVVLRGNDVKCTALLGTLNILKMQALPTTT